MLASKHEAILQRSKTQGAGRRRPRSAKGRGRKDLLGLGAHHQTLAQEAPRNRRRRAKADPRASSSQGSGTPTVVALPAATQQRPDPPRASRGLRRRDGCGGLDLHGKPGHRAPARRTLAAQKKSQLAQERDEEVRGLWRWLASHFDARRIVFVDESGFHTSTATRLRARAPKGERAYGKVPRNRGVRTPRSSPRSPSKEVWESR